MNRRTFLMASATSLFLPISAHAYSFIPYTPAAWNGLKQSDQTVILNFRASWSLTCNQNLELIAQLLGQNSDYRNLTFVDVNWDHYGQSVMASRLKVKCIRTYLCSSRCCCYGGTSCCTTTSTKQCCFWRPRRRTT